MLWFDRAGLGPDDYATLAERTGIRRPRVLAWAATDAGVVVALPDRLVVREGDDWSEFGWADVVRGGWDSTREAFAWTLTDGTSGGVSVQEPGRLPEVFRERINASIVVNQPLDQRGCRGVAIVARRNPSARDATLTWQTVTSAGIDPADPTIAPVVAEELARLRAEYDIR